jgi:hypothetical protein
MAHRSFGPAIRVALVAGVFAAGFFCGSLAHRDADAQVGDMLKKAGESGALGSVGQLGAAIVDMQEHVSALQKNLDTLKKVKSALGG